MFRLYFIGRYDYVVWIYMKFAICPITAWDNNKLKNKLTMDIQDTVGIMAVSYFVFWKEKIVEVDCRKHEL